MCRGGGSGVSGWGFRCVGEGSPVRRGLTVPTLRAVRQPEGDRRSCIRGVVGYYVYDCRRECLFL